MRSLVALVLLLSFAAYPVAAQNEIIDEIIEAQYTGCERATAEFKRKTLMNVSKACVGRPSCRMVSRAAADEMMCSKLVVRLMCSNNAEKTFVRKVSDGVMSFSCN
jgi:hypothetical protein